MRTLSFRCFRIKLVFNATFLGRENLVRVFFSCKLDLKNNTFLFRANIFVRSRLVYTRHVTEYVPAKTGEYPSDIAQFSRLRMLRKIFEG